MYRNGPTLLKPYDKKSRISGILVDLHFCGTAAPPPLRVSYGSYKRHLIHRSERRIREPEGSACEPASFDPRLIHQLFPSRTSCISSHCGCVSARTPSRLVHPHRFCADKVHQNVGDGRLPIPAESDWDKNPIALARGADPRASHRPSSDDLKMTAGRLHRRMPDRGPRHERA